MYLEVSPILVRRGDSHHGGFSGIAWFRIAHDLYAKRLQHKYIEFLLLSFKYCFITDPSQSWSDPRVFLFCPQDSSKDGSKEPESGDKKEGGS